MTRLGRLVFGTAMIALGVFCLRGDFFYTWSGIPDGLPARAVFSYANGAVLIALGVGVMIDERSEKTGGGDPAGFAGGAGGRAPRGIDRAVRGAALALAALWLLYTACHVPGFVCSWRPYLGQIAEPAGLAGCALVLASRGRGDLRSTLGRAIFGLCLPLYGVVHLLYPQAVAGFIPSWIPARQFWAYFTACAFIAAGLAVLSGVLIRTASVLVAVMFTSWVVLLHIPRLLAARDDPHEWATTFVALAFAGAAWAFAGRQAA